MQVSRPDQPRSGKTPSPALRDTGGADAKPFTGEDLRFTRSGDAIHAFFLDWPSAAGRITALGLRSMPDAVIEQVSFQNGQPLRFTRDAEALQIELPPPNGLVPRVTIRGRGLV